MDIGQTDNEIVAGEGGRASGGRKAGGPDVAAVSHAIGILKIIGQSRDVLGVNELARRVGLHKSTVSRLLATLERHGFVDRDPDLGRFSLGVELVALAGPFLANLDVVRASRKILARTADETGETVFIGTWNGRDVILIERAMGERAVAHYASPGTAMPAHASAAGKIFLSGLSRPALDAILAGELTTYTPLTVTDPVQLREELEEIRSLGFAIMDQEYQLESCGIAAPIRDFRGDIIAVLSIAIPKHRFDARQQRNLAVIVVRNAAELSRSLGYVPSPLLDNSRSSS